MSDPATRVRPQDRVECNGRPALYSDETHRYFAYYKPAGLEVSRPARHTGKTIYDALPAALADLDYAGRLDRESRGLLLLSDDGKFIQRVTHPSGGLEKHYRVRVSELTMPTAALIRRFKAGISDEGELLLARNCEVVNRAENTVEVTLSGGRKRQLRRMFRALGMEVTDLFRFRIGELDLDRVGMASGAWLAISPEDVTGSA